MFCFAIIAAMMTIYKREFAAKKLKEKSERQELARQKVLKKQQETELTREEERRVEDAAFAAARRRK